VKLIFAVDAIFPPLTGIGRYAWELATRLAESARIDDLRFISNFGWIAQPRDLLPQTAPQRRIYLQWASALRTRAAGSRLGVALFARLAPMWKKALLKPYGSYLFHSPNYFVPPRDGISIATVHDLSIRRFPQTHPAARVHYFNMEFERSLARCRHLITDSEAVRAEVIATFGWPADRIEAIALGVSDAFHPRSAAQTEPVIRKWQLRFDGYTLCVSTLEPRKNLETLLDAYTQLPESIRTRFPLVLAGKSGWHDQRLKERIARYAAQGWLRYVDYVDQDELPLLYSGARVFCFPSKYEGFGLPVLESMASGVPLVVSKAPCLMELCGDFALSHEPDDASALRNALERALADDIWRSATRAEGLARSRNYTWSSCFDRTVDVYERVSAA
jgi:alpha-1,3-rhamnosyl/mannosyltransferase